MLFQVEEFRIVNALEPLINGNMVQQLNRWLRLNSHRIKSRPRLHEMKPRDGERERLFLIYETD